MLNTFLTVIKMESKKFFSNKKMLISAFLVPTVLMGFIIFSISSIGSMEEKGKINVYCSKDTYQTLSNSDIDDSVQLIVSNKKNSLKSDVSSSKNVVGITIDDIERKIIIGYDSSALENKDLLYQASEIERNINMKINATEYYETYVDGEPNMMFNDVSGIEDIVSASLKSLLSMISTMAVMLACVNLITLSTDIIAGEKERGTFDIYRLSGSNVFSIVFGKTLFLTILGFITLCLEWFVTALCIKYVNPDLFDMVVECCENIYAFILCIALLAIILAIFISTCFVFVSSFFEKAKQASSYCSIGMVIITMAMSASMVVDWQWIEYVPIANFIVTIMHVLTNQSYISALLISACISVFVSLIALWYSAKRMERNLSL